MAELPALVPEGGDQGELCQRHREGDRVREQGRRETDRRHQQHDEKFDALVREGRWLQAGKVGSFACARRSGLAALKC